jgi:membrane protease YdiL (CAAX protease family)
MSISSLPQPEPRHRAQREALTFVALSLGLAAIYGCCVLLSARGALPFAIPGGGAGAVVAALTRTFGPALAAILCAALLGGREGLGALWRTFAHWRAPAWLWALALLGPFAAMLVVVAVGVATGTLQRAPLDSPPLRFAVVFVAMAIVDGPLGEEIGWRGYLLPRLLALGGPLRASLLVGAVWWLWHVPLYLADGRELSAGDWGVYLLTTLALSLVFTWFWLRSGGSTLMAILLHDATNFAVYLLLMNLWTRTGSELPQRVRAAVVVAAGAAAAVALLRRRDDRATPPWPAPAPPPGATARPRPADRA